MLSINPCHATDFFSLFPEVLLMFSGSIETQLVFTCSESTILTLEKGVKYVQS